MADYSKQSLQIFLAELASEKGAPGGGAAAAVTGAMAASLLGMTVRINRKRTGKQNTNGALALLRSIDTSREMLLRLMREDAAAFEKINQLYKKKEKGELWQRALKQGAEVPLKMSRVLSDLAPHMLREKKWTSAWLMSDLVESAILCRAAFQSARLNIEVNLRGIKDAGYARQVNQKLGAMERRLKRYDFSNS